MKLKLCFLYIIFIFAVTLQLSLCFSNPEEIDQLKGGYDPRDDHKNYNNYKNDDKKDSDRDDDEDESDPNRPKKNNTIIYEPVKNVYVPTLTGDKYWTGWIKYFHYDGDTPVEKPESFYENPDYFKQIVKEHKYNRKGSDGHRIYIPGKNYFWAQLLASGNLNILGSRDNAESPRAHTIENMNTDLIGYIQHDNNASGAITDLGTFHEGSCIKIKLKVPDTVKNPNFNPRTDDGNTIVWVICLDDEKHKKELMEFLVAIKLRRQSQIDDVLVEKKEEPKSADEFLNSKVVGPVIVRYKGRDASEDDGFWVLLQDWSDCSLKCGGGVQTQQWICVPPKGKGKPCIGDSIRKRPCNLEACPNTYSQKALIQAKPEGVTLTPIYRALPYSNRPQQYVKCVIKEYDVMYKTAEFDPEKKIVSKVPGRIVMNTHTISVFTDDTYDHALFNFNLQDTMIKANSKDYCCFFLINANRQYEVCAFNNNCGTETNPKWVNEWWKDFDYFKSKCHRELKENSLNVKPNELNELLPNQPGVGVPLNGTPLKLSMPQQALVQGERSIIKNKIEEHQEEELNKKVEETQNTALVALRREINLEDMIKAEEAEKGKKENEELEHEVEQERKKKKVLQKALMARESNYAEVRKTKETKREMEDIKKDAKVEIKFKRAVLKKKLDAIRKKYTRKNRLLQQQVQLLRSEEAEMVMDANRKGDQNKCKDARGDIAKIKQYCDSAFSDDYQQNETCKEPVNFCYTCCDHEFGGMFISQRDDCQSMCDNLDKADLEDGDWVWSIDGSEAPPKSPTK